jgi:hypothetical protein
MQHKLRLPPLRSALASNEKLPPVMPVQFISKVGVEILFTPITYKIVGKTRETRR